MKTEYAPDNTTSSIVILVVLAAVITGIAAIIGLSDKPDVSTIVITPAGEEPAIVVPANNFGFDTAETDDADAEGADSDVLLDELGQPFEATSTDQDAAPTADTSDAADDQRDAPEGEIIVVPTLEPTATPEVAAAVQPTPVPDESSDDAADPATSSALAPSLPTTSGTVEGAFFTKGDENDGAVVSQNLITVSFAEDGSGSFQGVLDITYANDTHILLNMSGPLTWTASNPQVEATLEGAFTLDAVIDADDVTATDAKLSISSLQAGSGSLCTTKCFGFTFPPQ